MPRGRGILVGIRGGTRSARRGSIDGKGCASSVRSFAKSGITSFTRRLDKVAKGAKSDTVAASSGCGEYWAVGNLAMDAMARSTAVPSRADTPS